MKRTFILLALALSVLSLSAQELKEDAFSNDSVAVDDALCAPSYDTGITLWRGSYPGFSALSLPVFRPGFYGPAFGGLWDIHSGLNASVDMGVSVGFGKNNPWRGAHFFTDIAALYAYPVNDRLTLAAGMDYCHFTGLGNGHSSLGIFGLANYRINDRLDVTGFLSHDFGPLSSSSDRFSTRMPYVPGMMGPSTTIGADLGIKVGENTKFNIGLSFTREQDGPSFMHHPQQLEMHQNDRQR